MSVCLSVRLLSVHAKPRALFLSQCCPTSEFPFTRNHAQNLTLDPPGTGGASPGPTNLPGDVLQPFSLPRCRGGTGSGPGVIPLAWPRRCLRKKNHKLKLSESQFRPMDGEWDEGSRTGRNRGCASSPFPPGVAHRCGGAGALALEEWWVGRTRGRSPSPPALPCRSILFPAAPRSPLPGVNGCEQHQAVRQEQPVHCPAPAHGSRGWRGHACAGASRLRHG